MIFTYLHTSFAKGLSSEITGVTLQDLRERTQSDYEQISQAVSMRMAGMGAGAIFGESVNQYCLNLEPQAKLKINCCNH